jgi:hypothetical protein
MRYVFFLEEESMEHFLHGLLPRVIPKHYPSCLLLKHEGKSHLLQSLHTKLRAWRDPNARFIVLHDQDSNDCHALKQELVEVCRNANHQDAIIRIVCRELESWYLGNLSAVEEAFGLTALVKKYDNKARFRNPDTIGSPAEELMRIVPEYRKVSGSQSIGAVFDHTTVNSKSFEVFLTGLNRLTGMAP